MRKHAATILKIAITLGALAWVLTHVDLQGIWARLQQAEVGWVVLGFLLVNSSLLVRGGRWGILLTSLGESVPYWRLVALYFVGNFFNSVLPSGFSGDVVRAVEVTQNVPPQIAAGTVVVDRLLGLMALFVLGLAALPFRPEAFPDLLAAQITAVCLIGLVGGLIILDGRLVRWCGRFVPKFLRPLWAKLDKALLAISACGWRAVFYAFLVSLGFNLMQIGWWAAAGAALGDDIPFSYYFLIVPIMSIAILLPSIGGLGVRESLAPLLFAGAALNSTEAVSLSLLVFGIERISGLFGAPIYIATALQQRRAVTPDSG